MMTRKDYIAVAEILNNHFSNYPVEIADFRELVLDFCDFFAEDNPNFKENKFLEAVYGKESVVK
jgi:Fe-S-cluster formation regulator IscX/YfhJ